MKVIVNVHVMRDTSITGTLSNTLEENIMNVSNGDDSVEEDTNNKSGIVGNEFEESVTNESNASVGKELEDKCIRMRK